MKQLITTQFMAATDVLLPTIVGGGWNARIEMQVKAKAGDIFTCETYQTPDCKHEDNSVRLNFPSEKITGSFEDLGRLIACGAIKQYEPGFGVSW